MQIYLNLCIRRTQSTEICCFYLVHFEVYEISSRENKIRSSQKKIILIQKHEVNYFVASLFCIVSTSCLSTNRSFSEYKCSIQAKTVQT